MGRIHAHCTPDSNPIALHLQCTCISPCQVHTNSLHCISMNEMGLYSFSFTYCYTTHYGYLKVCLPCGHADKPSHCQSQFNDHIVFTCRPSSFPTNSDIYRNTRIGQSGAARTIVNVLWKWGLPRTSVPVL